MRFLLKEQPYEKSIASGRLYYRKNGRFTGAIEHWRYTAAFDGYHFLRVDLDGRESSGHSYLYNLLLNPNGRPEQLKYRFFAKQIRVAGQLLFENGEVIAVHEINKQRTESVFVDTNLFWFPSAIGLGLLGGSAGNERKTAVATTLNSEMNNCSNDCLAPHQVEITLTNQDNRLKMSWQGKWRTILCDTNGFVRHMSRDDGLEATSDRPRS